ncbi:Uma2 family endonuclease [Aurantimonas sp. MSK8Z-1]|uniref:Uma2 family endonuclease n=1 Tax=Mangrovibrevibacter kandeliae TaxID=2968473 RepID=UPI002118D3DD|nr:Uma2 family endonuclease [Aurantimonas sp. MSK8Z-1]MCW4116837.1 Uma2 family endonuclease [Aurantimonas sp. MSK8Z-1]
MNAPFRMTPDKAPPQPKTTQAAEGLRRRPFSVAEIRAMVEAGIMDEDERVELIGGELVPMASKGIRHERMKTWVMMQLATKLPPTIAFTPETTFTLSVDTFLEPDFVVYEKALGLERLDGETCLLAIEISDTSLAYDQGRKASLFSVFGVRELWVIDVNAMSVRIHREPTPTGYRLVADHGAEVLVQPMAAQDFELRLAEFD